MIVVDLKSGRFSIEFMAIASHRKANIQFAGRFFVLLTVFAFISANLYCFGHAENKSAQPALSAEVADHHDESAHNHSNAAEQPENKQSHDGHDHSDAADVCCSALISILPSTLHGFQSIEFSGTFQPISPALVVDYSELIQSTTRFVYCCGPPGQSPVPVLLFGSLSARAPPVCA